MRPHHSEMQDVLTNRRHNIRFRLQDFPEPLVGGFFFVFYITLFLDLISVVPLLMRWLINEAKHTLRMQAFCAHWFHFYTTQSSGWFFFLKKFFSS